jgi:hypothetical protein
MWDSLQVHGFTSLGVELKSLGSRFKGHKKDLRDKIQAGDEMLEMRISGITKCIALLNKFIIVQQRLILSF